jgi:hypothetical protein
MRRQDTIYPSTKVGPSASALSFNQDFLVPPDAVGAVFFLNVSQMSGTTPLLDLKFQYVDPVSGAVSDVPGASIVQMSAAALRVITIDPRITASANVGIVQPLGRVMRAVFTLDNTTTNSENYTFSLGVRYSG